MYDQMLRSDCETLGKVPGVEKLLFNPFLRIKMNTCTSECRCALGKKGTPELDLQKSLGLLEPRWFQFHSSGEDHDRHHCDADDNDNATLILNACACRCLLFPAISH
jgi:hypothetical protein